MSLWARAKKSVSERAARNWSPAAQPNRAPGPMVSFTFDDFPKSAVEKGASVLESRGVRGSFYVAGRFQDQREDDVDYFSRDDLAALAAQDHEIGCHTFGHLRLPFASEAEIRDDLARNRDFLEAALPGYRMSTFAYPYGHVNIGRKALIGRHFETARGIFPGVNRGRIDFQQLKAIPLEQRSFTLDQGLEAMESARRDNGWVIFFSHDVSNTPTPYGCTPDELARLADAALEMGLKVAPLRQAAEIARNGAPRAAEPA